MTSKFSLFVALGDSPIAIKPGYRCLPVAAAVSFVVSDNPDLKQESLALISAPPGPCVIDQITIDEVAMFSGPIRASELSSHREVITAAIGLGAELDGVDHLLGVVDDLEGLLRSLRLGDRELAATALRSFPRLEWGPIFSDAPLAVHTNTGPVVVSLLVRRVPRGGVRHG